MNPQDDEPTPEMITAEFWEGHLEKIEKAAETVGIDKDTLIRAATMRAVKEVEDTGSMSFGSPRYTYNRLTGVRGPNGGIFVSFEMNATAYQLIDKLLNKYTISHALSIDYVAQVQLLKVIDTLSDPIALLKLIDRDADTIGHFIARYEAFNEANPDHAERVKELMGEMKQSKAKKAA